MENKVAVVGAGAWGKNLVRNFHALGALALICEIDPKIASRHASLHQGVPITDDFEAVLKDPAIRGVVIATPVELHYSMARRALEAGKDVFVEKPLAAKAEKGADLVELSNEKGLILMVGHILLYHPAVLKLKEFVDKGELGSIHYVYSNRLNLGKVRQFENILWSFAPHDISVILMLLGRTPLSVSTHGASYLQPEVADVTVTNLRFEDDVRAHIFVSWLHPYKEQRLVVVGDKKMAVFNDMAKEEKLKIHDKGIEMIDGKPMTRQISETTLFFPEEEPLRSECEHFLQCMETRERPRSDGENGLQVLRILAASQESLESKGKIVRLEETG